MTDPTRVALVGAHGSMTLADETNLVWVVHDVAAWCEEVSRTGRTFRALGAPWAAG